MPKLTDAEIAEARNVLAYAPTNRIAHSDHLIRLVILARTLLPRLIEEVAALRADRDRLDELQRLVLDGADIVRDDERLIVFIQKDDSRTCGPLYVYRGDGENALRDAVDAARK